jgi:hypothetical protein
MGLCLFFLAVNCNSLLATLNLRKAIRSRAHDSFGMSMYPISGSDPGPIQIQVRSSVSQHRSQTPAPMELSRLEVGDKDEGRVKGDPL